MEEWIGQRWHHLVTWAADRSFPAHAVRLADVERAAGVLFRAAGGASGVRVVPAAPVRTGGPRTWLQRAAGSGQRAALAQLDGDTLALPPVVAVFDDSALNRDLYLWLAVLAAVHEPVQTEDADWLTSNRCATALALQRCPGLLPRWQRLRTAQLLQRPALHSLKQPAALAEAAVQAALRNEEVPPRDCDGCPTPRDVAPVWVWLQCLPLQAAAQVAVNTSPQARSRAASPQPDAPPDSSATRRRTRRAQPAPGRAPLLLPSRTESVVTWSEHVPLDRGTDDEPDPQATAAADDMDQLTLSRDGGAVAAQVRFDLDLPSASADDLPLGGPGAHLLLPEWDWKHQRLLPDHCRVFSVVARAGAAYAPPPALRATARQVRRRLEVLRAAPSRQRGCTDGDGIDLDAWVRHQSGGPEMAVAATPVSAIPSATAPTPRDPAIYTRAVRGQRSLATLLLADMSLSTDAYVNNDQRVVDVIRDALWVFGQALQGTGDAFEMLGFSSVRRSHVRLQHLKAFDEPWNSAVQARVGAIKPGYYTRMGAALRAATLRLQPRPERQRLLLILTDGKPNDIDTYEGRWGLEDTRHAVLEARTAGLLPFCISIDEKAGAYLPHLFGQRGWARVQRPSELPGQLAMVYARLTR